MKRLSGLAVALFLIGSTWNAFAQPNDVVRIDKKTDIKVVYDVKVDEWDAGVGKALYYVRGLFEAYRKQGVPPEELHISIVVHGAPVYWLIDDEHYQWYREDPFATNPNEHVIASLISLGASVEACNSSMKGKGWKPEDLQPGVIAVHDGYTRLIELQQRGYSYIRF